jgi:peptidoglycan pentaglycine glycine transferase (the first glycine)
MWYIPLTHDDQWSTLRNNERTNKRDTEGPAPATEEELLKTMRKTTRNLIGRAEREGVTVAASVDPSTDLDIYFRLQKETTQRHGFVPYREAFIRAQVRHFAPLGQAIVYVARSQDEPLAASVHMTYAGVTSYHHGASTHRHPKIPASYLLQWTAIRDALRRGDSIYNFWGIAPPSRESRVMSDEHSVKKTQNSKLKTHHSKHPFAGVTTFKTGFGGTSLPLLHCRDIPLSTTYRFTRIFETVRKWKRGF